MFKILVVEDDANLNRTVCTFLKNHNYKAVGCSNGNEAYDVLYNDIFDLVISDIMMPGVDGYELATNIRNLDTNIPILFMSAKDDLFSKQKSFNIGIDDYLVKPFEVDELIMRVDALLRRARIEKSKKLVVGGFEMDIEERTATLNGEDVALTAREFNLLYKFLSFPRKTFTRSQLMDEFWDSDSNTGSRAVDVYITKLRERLVDCDDFEIVTVHGLGYKVTLK